MLGKKNNWCIELIFLPQSIYGCGRTSTGAVVDHSIEKTSLPSESCTHVSDGYFRESQDLKGRLQKKRSNWG